MINNGDRFPGKRYSNCADYFDAYEQECARALCSISREQLNKSAELLLRALITDSTIFCCGNGGSAAIANHFQCDHQKGIHTDTDYRPKFVSLSANVALLTAIANDIGYEDVYAFPLKLHARPGDLLVTISSSGNSENIVRALQTATAIGVASISFTGFSGGRSRALSTANIHVNSNNYGVIEDAHQSCMHVLAQFIRQEAMCEDMIKQRLF